MVIYQADGKKNEKKSSLVFVVNKSQYHDTHSDVLVMCETLIIFPLFGVVSSKQHTNRGWN